MEFPRLMYQGGAAKTLGVADEAARQAALKDGWFDSVPEAIAGKSDAPTPPPAPVAVFKKTGVRVEKFTAKDQAEADALMAGDGWHPSEAAAIAATWPAADAVPGIVEELAKATPDELATYAAGLGMKPHKGEKPAALLARIETTLLTGAPAGKA